MSLLIPIRCTKAHSYNLNSSTLSTHIQHWVTEGSISTRLIGALLKRCIFQGGKSLNSQKLPVIPTRSSWDWGSFLGAANWCWCRGHSRHQRKQHDTDSFTLSGPYGNCQMWPIGLLLWEFVTFMNKIWAQVASFLVLTRDMMCSPKVFALRLLEPIDVEKVFHCPNTFLNYLSPPFCCHFLTVCEVSFFFFWSFHFWYNVTNSLTFLFV